MKTTIASIISCAAIAGALLCTAAIPAQADTITVTNTNDSGPGSLRQALADANDGDTIEFAVTGTIGLTSGELLVDRSITISGPGADNLAVDGNAKSRVFYMHSGKTVIISELTITNGSAPSASGAAFPMREGRLHLITALSAATQLRTAVELQIKLCSRQSH